MGTVYVDNPPENLGLSLEMNILARDDVNPNHGHAPDTLTDTCGREDRRCAILHDARGLSSAGRGRRPAFADRHSRVSAVARERA